MTSEDKKDEQAPVDSGKAKPEKKGKKDKKPQEPVVETPAVVESSDVEVTVPADMLKDALVQLKKLATLRRQEAERQRLALARMEEQMKRHSRVNRLVLLASLVVLFSIFVVSTLMRQVVANSRGMQDDLKTVNTGLGVTAQTVRESAVQQAEQLESATAIVRLSAAEQAAGLQHSTAMLIETAEAQGRRIGEVGENIEVARHEQKLLAKHIGETVSDMRQEREAVRAEVRNVLDEKTREFASREIELKNQAEEVKQQAAKAREERRQIINDAISKLSALEGMAEDKDPAAVEPQKKKKTVTPPPDSTLTGYSLKAGPIEIDGVTDNASGITFNPETQTLFAVRNDPPLVCELGLDGSTRRTITLTGFEDTEGIVHIGGTQFAVIEERRRVLCRFDIDASTRFVNHDDVARILVDPIPAGNQGLEGIAFDAQKGCLFIVKEKGPRKIYSLPLAGPGETTTEPGLAWDIEQNGFGLSDLSAAHAVAGKGSLLLLSDESKCLVECTLEGEEIGRLPLIAGSAGLAADMGQPEGVTLDDEGRLYVVSEPNQLYIFSKN